MKAKEIISKIYVDAHIKEFPNAVEYTGSLSPEKTKAVDSALLALKEMVLSKKKSVDYRIGEPDLSQNEAFNEAIDSVFLTGYSREQNSQ